MNAHKIRPHTLDTSVHRAASGLAPRCKRILMYLLESGRTTTGELAHECQCGNISDAVLLMLPTLEVYGVTIRNYLPETLLKNRFGEVSQAHVWELAFLDG